MLRHCDEIGERKSVKLRRNNGQLTTSSVVPPTRIVPLAFEPGKRSSAFTLDGTSLNIANPVDVVHSSDGLGWSDMAAAITLERPHQIYHEPVSSLWLAMLINHAPPQKDGDALLLRRSIGHDVFEGTASGGGFNVALPGNFVITPPGNGAEDTILRESTVFHLFLKESLLHEVGEKRFGKRIDDFDYKNAFALNDPVLTSLLLAARHMLKEPEGSGWRSDYCARALAAQVLSRHVQVMDSAPRVDTGTKLSRRQTGLVRDFLLSQLDGDFNSSELAAVAGLSRTTFFERFARTMQQTPHQYLQGLRVERAKQLLRSSQLSLSEVSVACGFFDQTHMTRIFKRFVKATPRRYRNELS